MKEFITRTVTAVFLLAFAYLVIEFASPVIFSLILFILVSTGADEFVRLTGPARFSRLLLLVNGLLVALAFTFGKPDFLLAVALAVILTGLFFLFSIRDPEGLSTFVRDIGIHFLVIFYLYVPLYFLLELKRLGPHYLFFLIGVIAIGDSAAYFIGRAIGKHKIYPVASPRKSLEGLIAAVIFAAASGWLCRLIFPLEGGVVLWRAILSGGIIGLFSQLSDPVESLFKRAANKKDSSSLIPGHGGILDRVDSYIFCAPVLFILVRYFWS